MSDILKKYLPRINRTLQVSGIRSRRSVPLGRQFAMLTCIDVRFDRAKYAGLFEGDGRANCDVGGRASHDDIQSSVKAYELGDRE